MNLAKLQQPEKTQELEPTKIPFELLIIGARTQLDRHDIERRDLILQQSIDWQQLIEAAARNGVAPLLYWNLKDSPYLSPEIQLQLKRKFFDNLKKNTLQTRELNEIVQHLKRSQIAAVPFKGAILATSIYGSLALREFGDLDLLIAATDFVRAKKILIERGYQPKENWFLNETQELAFIYRNGEFSYISQNGAIDLDLHTRLIAGHLFTLNADLDYVWRRLQKVTVLGQELETLQLEDNLIYLCIHGAKSFWERLIWISDVAQLIHRHNELDWQYLWTKSRLLGCQKMLLLGCYLAHHLLSAQLPEEVQSRLRSEPQIIELADIVVQKLQGKVNYPCVDEYTFHSYWFYFRVFERWQDRLNCSWHYLFGHLLAPVTQVFVPNDLDRKFIKLPPGWDWLYYFLKPVRAISQLFN